MFRRSPISRVLVFVAALPVVVMCGGAALAQFAVPGQPGLPPEAQAVLSAFEQETRAIAQQAEQAIHARREQTIARLQALQDQRTRAGDLDGALAVRDRIRALVGAGANRGPILTQTRVAAQ